ncbi:MAG: hypothetical protein HYT38_02745, partial [Candidatus Sungbacteria bacterium]|nr:hypothetical protein [Candidatus Sungbacteria bacterium]
MKKFCNSTAAAMLVLGSLAVFFNFYFTTLAGVDGYYHIRHAWIYATQGIFNSAFPWLQYSVVGQLGTDIWYGFHIFLIPFSLLGDLLLGLRLAATVITFAALAGFYTILKKLEIRWPVFWTLLFFFSAPDVNFRLLMVRPHILTFILVLTLFYALVKNRSGKLIFSLSAGVAFIHLAMAWLPILMAIIVNGTQKIVGGKWEIKKNLAGAAGLIVGWLARPEPFSAIKLAYIQVVQLAIEKFNNTPLRFGVELRPGNRLSVVINEILPVAFLIMLAVISLILLIKKHGGQMEKTRKVIMGSSLAISIIFGFITYGVARRAADIWIGFGLVFVGLAISIFYEHYAGVFNKLKIKLVVLASILLLGFTANTLRFTLDYFKNLPPTNAFQESADWLKTHTRPGDIVFNIHWDNFPSLFFWNQHNYYINGMDPIFEYAFNKNLYLEHYFIDIDKVFIYEGEAYTCTTNPCGPGAIISVYDSLKNNFKADYIFIEMARNPIIYKYL